MAPSPERCLLLLADDWFPTRDELYAVNRHLALTLSRFSGVKVYCAVLKPLSQVEPASVKDADSHGVKLIGTDFDQTHIYEEFNKDPESVFPGLFKNVPGVTHIIGHSPVTAEGAIKLRDKTYSDSKVLLFYHIIPDDVSWLSCSLPYTMPSDTDLVRLAEQADVVYAVSEKLHWHYRAKFRNRASKKIDLRLFLPQSAKEVFDVIPEAGKNQSSAPVVLAFSFGPPCQWTGLDIVACAINKVGLAMMDKPNHGPLPKLVIGNVQGQHRDAIKAYIAPYITVATMDVEYHAYTGLTDFQEDLKKATLAILPSRAEPFGNLALSVLSAGVPCLLAEDCAVASLIRYLTPEPENILVPVVPSTAAVRQDASVWRDRILRILSDLPCAVDQAAQLKLALRRDESTKVTHDDVVCYCLGGIKLHHHITNMEFKIEDDAELELPVLRATNRFVSEALRQCWRLKHHPLTTTDDLLDLLPHVDIPHKKLIRLVTDKIEEYDRRVVGLDPKSGAFLVYCPTPFALCDLWAMCDVINGGLVKTLLSGANGDVLGHFGLRKAQILTTMSGPEFLAYKRELVSVTRPRTAAF